MRLVCAMPQNAVVPAGRNTRTRFDEALSSVHRAQKGLRNVSMSSC